MAGLQGLGQALSTGSGVANGPAQIHHIATNKGIQSGYTEKFEKIFSKAGMSLEDPLNKMTLPGHLGRHSERYHRYVLERLTKAVSGHSGDAYRQALVKELGELHKAIQSNPDIVRGVGIP